uniref:Putative tick kunitz 53 n=1 Tax=Ixodes ricinus TaxID=34613 RepID=V5GG04_IXORI
MKATLAVTCFLTAVVLISALSKELCEAPRAIASCASDVTPVTSYYYNNRTGTCEEDFGCGNGPNNFPSEEVCKSECPYGTYASNV